MAENSKIEWTHHTFNPWRGCTKISAGCANCYAQTLSGRNPRSLGVWGPRGTRVVAAESYWKLPEKWNAAAKAAGERHRVFCASLADVFEGPETMPVDSANAVEEARMRLWDLIYRTPDLDWLLLTKRPENVADIIGGTSGAGLSFMEANMRNVWIGTSVEDQAAADKRIHELLRIPAAVRFLSCEPLLGPLDLNLHRVSGDVVDDHCEACDERHEGRCDPIDWVIVGGESGHGARPFDIEWAKSIRKQCKAAGVACFIKQLGSNPVEENTGDNMEYVDNGGNIPVELNDKKGGDWNEWPEELRVREFPKLATPLGRS